MPHLVVILDRKYWEEALAAYYWNQPQSVQEGFLRAYHQQIPDSDAGVRITVSTVIANMAETELSALAQHVIGQPA